MSTIWFILYTKNVNVLINCFSIIQGNGCRDMKILSIIRTCVCAFSNFGFDCKVVSLGLTHPPTPFVILVLCRGQRLLEAGCRPPGLAREIPATCPPFRRPSGPLSALEPYPRGASRSDEGTHRAPPVRSDASPSSSGRRERASSRNSGWVTGEGEPGRPPPLQGPLEGETLGKLQILRRRV